MTLMKLVIIVNNYTLPCDDGDDVDDELLHYQSTNVYLFIYLTQFKLQLLHNINII